MNRCAVALICTCALFALPGCGADPKANDAAGPTPAVSAAELGAGAQAKGIELGVKGPLTVTYRKITLPPGSGTGKHCHDGNLIAVVKQGTLTHYAPIYPSGVHSYHAGDSIFEGSGYVHEGKNLGKSDVVLMVTYVTPKGDPLAETDLKRCDAA